MTANGFPEIGHGCVRGVAESIENFSQEQWQWNTRVFGTDFDMVFRGPLPVTFPFGLDSPLVIDIPQRQLGPHSRHSRCIVREWLGCRVEIGQRDLKGDEGVRQNGAPFRIVVLVSIAEGMQSASREQRQTRKSYSRVLTQAAAAAHGRMLLASKLEDSQKERGKS